MAGERGYKRSWKNLLINKRYQLRFTLFMVGLSGLLMIGLGIWVMKEANEATNVGMASVRGVACGPLEISELAGSAAPDDDLPPTPMKLDDGDGSGSGSAAAATGSGSGSGSGSGAVAIVDAAGSAAAAVVGSDAGSGSGSGSDAEPPRHHIKVQLDESQMTMVPQPVPPVKAAPTEAELTAQKVTVFANRVCAAGQKNHFGYLEFGHLRIFLVLIFTGLALIIGLAVYGIKMTHKVAGPLFKVSLYLNKMRDGRLDKVWNLRKGDQLVDFYDHFKAAHAGMVTLEKADIERLQAVIAAAEASGLGEHATVVQLRAIVARKEKALV